MKPSEREPRQTFEDAVDHIHVAYRFFAACVPRPEQFASGSSVRIGRFEFQEPSQAESMRIELAWAFFTRLDAAFEALTHRLDLTPSAVSERLRESGEFSDEDLLGFKIARELRNIFHHGDGDATLLRNQATEVRPGPGHEPHLNEPHMEQFVALFRRAAEVLTRPRLRVV